MRHEPVVDVVGKLFVGRLELKIQKSLLVQMAMRNVLPGVRSRLVYYAC